MVYSAARFLTLIKFSHGGLSLSLFSSTLLFVFMHHGMLLSDATIAVNTSESVSWDKIPHIEICRRASQMACLQGEDAPEHLSSEGTNSSSLLIPGPEGSQLPRKAGKIPRSSGLPSGCFKRPRTAQTEDSTRLSGADDMKGISSYPTKCTYPGNTFLHVV